MIGNACHRDDKIMRDENYQIHGNIMIINLISDTFYELSFRIKGTITFPPSISYTYSNDRLGDTKKCVGVINIVHFTVASSTVTVIL